MLLKELREKAGKLAGQIRAKSELIGKEGYTWTAEDETEWKRLNDEYDQVSDQIDKLQRSADIDARMNQRNDRDIGRDDHNGDRRNDRQGDRSEITDEHRSLAFRSWFLDAGGCDLPRRHREACRALRFNPRARRVNINLARTNEVHSLAAECRQAHPQQRTMSAITGNVGGAFVPDGFLNQLERNMLFFGTVLQEASIMRTDNGSELPMPMSDDTSNEGEIVGESADMDGSTDPSTSALKLFAHKFSSKMIKVPVELFEDSAFDIETFVGDLIGERLGRVQNRKYTVGTGVKEPRGYMTGATLGVTAASATAITGDELTVDLVHSLDPAYRAGAIYAFHDTVLAHVRKLKDGSGRSLFQSNLAEGFPDTIDGRRYMINQHMASSVATGNKTVAFGNFRKYIVRQVRGVRFRRLDERYAEKDQVAFLALLRADGNLLDAGTAPIKYLQQA